MLTFYDEDVEYNQSRWIAQHCLCCDCLHRHNNNNNNYYYYYYHHHYHSY